MKRSRICTSRRTRRSCGLIKATVDAARKAGIWVGVCGEMAGDPMLTPLLLGLGVDELSAAPPLVPQIKFLIRRLKMSEAKALAEFALNCESGPEILARCQEFTREIAPSLFESSFRAANKTDGVRKTYPQQETSNGPSLLSSNIAGGPAAEPATMKMQISRTLALSPRGGEGGVGVGRVGKPISEVRLGD